MLRISVWNIAFTIINILVLFFFMRHFLMKPVMEILEERKKLVEKDLDEARLWDLVSHRKCVLITTVIGGQGHVFGRGNQQLSPRVIRKLGRENIEIIATKEKLLSLPGRRLLLDTGDAELDKELSGYAKVITGLDERTMCKIEGE